MALIDSEEVLVASRQSAPTTPSNSANSFCFTPRSSITASTTSAASFSSPSASTALSRSLPA